MPVADAEDSSGTQSKGERPPLEAVTRRLVKTRSSEKTEVCALVNLKCVN
jgi:hypothetical protein